MSNVLLKWTLPGVRDDGVTPVTVADVESVSVLRNGEVIATNGNVADGVQQYMDVDVANGAYDYTVTTKLKGANDSQPSNVAHVDIAVVPPQPLAALAVSDLTAEIQ